MNNYILEQRILETIETSRKETEAIIKIRDYNKIEIQNVFHKNLEESFIHMNSLFYPDKSSAIVLNEIKIENHKNYDKTLIGSGMVLAGQPLLKKRFVMKGSSIGTSIASKYFSKILPHKLPKRILGTRVLGRAIGRAVPYVGWALITIDVIEIIIVDLDDEEKYIKSKGFGGFGGGKFGGGGSGNSW